MTPHRSLVLVLATAALAASAGCSNGSTAPGPAAQPARSVAAFAPSSPTATPPNLPPSHSVASAAFPCSVFSLADIGAATGYDVVIAKPIVAVNDSSQRSCEYIDAQRHAFGVMTRKGGAAAALQVFSEIEGTGGPVTGIGDSAVGNQSELGVVFADDYVQVSDDSDASNDSATLAKVGLDKLKQMVRKVHAGM